MSVTTSTTAAAADARTASAPAVGARAPRTGRRAPYLPRPDAHVTAGVRAMAPMLAGFAPFALLVGAAVAASEHPLAAWLSTWTIYGGAAQLAVLDVLARDSGIAAAAVVGLLVNARLAAYATALAPHWREASWTSRTVAALTLTDVTWALAHRFDGDGYARRRYYLGAAMTLWFGWPAMVTAGVLTGHVFSGVPGFALLPVLTLGTLAVPHLRERPGLVTGVVATLAAAATTPLPSGIALPVSAVCGATAGVLAHRRAS
ncbi:MAG TPA: AzlC family ABC transporter permease [Nocardioidaceae bacterium]|nr:AzlC family ABC transporter permease [Nocardioidaceae bacterium]